MTAQRQFAWSATLLILYLVFLFTGAATQVPSASLVDVGGGIHIDPTISLGTIIHLIVLVSALVTMYHKVVARIVLMEKRISRVYLWLRAIVPQVPGIDPAVLLDVNGDDVD